MCRLGSTKSSAIFLQFFAALLCHGRISTSTDSDGGDGIFRNEILFQFLLISSWKHVTVITDQDNKHLLRSFSRALVTSRIINIDEKHNASIRLINPSTPERIRIVVFCKQSCQEHVIFSNTNLFTKRLSWLFMHEDQTMLDSFLNIKQLRLSLNPDSEVFSMVSTINEQYQVFRIPVLLDSARYDRDSKALCSVAIFSQKKWKLQPQQQQQFFPLDGHYLRLGVYSLNPIISYKKVGKKYVYGGLIAGLVEDLSKYLGFRYEFIISTRGGAGSILPNGSWTGVLAMLPEKEADAVTTGLALTTERLLVGDYTAHLADTSTVGMIAEPSDEGTTVNFITFILPFSQSTWLCTVAMSGLVLVCLAITKAHEIYLSDNNYDDNFMLWGSSASYAFWAVLAVGLQTDVGDLPRKRSSLTIIVLFFLFIVMISISYASTLTAILTVKKTKVLFNDFEEVLHDGTYNFLVERYTFQQRAFETAKDDIYEKVWQNMVANPTSLLSSSTEGLERILNEKSIFIVSRVFADIFCVKDCRYTYIQKDYLKQAAYLVFAKNSPYRDIVSRKLHAMRSAGILKRDWARFLFKREPYQCTKTSVINSIGIEQAIGAFMCLIFALLLAVLCFFVELLVGKFY